MSIGLLVSAWLVGALGGAHCFAMCGGLLGAISGRDAARSQTLHPVRALVARQAVYHAGRLSTYALLGTLFGAAGATALGIVDMLPVQRAVHVAANVLLLLLGASLVLRTPGVRALQRAGLASFAPVLNAVQPLLRRGDAVGRVAMGLVWGLMPCALIYGVLPLALVAGGAWQGGAVMLAFGLGTLPNLLGTGVLLAHARRFASAGAIRHASAAVMIAFGVLGIWRALVAPGALAQGPFCI